MSADGTGGEGGVAPPASSQDQSRLRFVPKIPRILPHERVFPIQIGSELFKLSGASISSDAPSYFSQYFQCQIKRAEESGEDISTVIRTLYIDRDPVTFKDISLHLQGYHVEPQDGTHFVRLFADAQFYNLPKLISQLYEESIFISIGHREFQVPRDLFKDPGNSPNFFNLGFAIFFSSPGALFPGLDRDGLIRPPSILPPSIPSRSAETFAELLHLLRGYPVQIRNEAHRAYLLRDCRYFNFRGVEQKLIPHSITFNQARRREEIALRLEDILKSGVSVAAEPTAADPLAGWVNYARPYLEDKPAELVLEIGNEATKLHLSSLRAEFFGDARTRIARLFEVLASKLSPPSTASEQPGAVGDDLLGDTSVRISLGPETSITLDGRPYTDHVPTESLGLEDSSIASPTSSSTANKDAATPLGPLPVNRKRRRTGTGGRGESEEWTVRTGQWRLRLQGAAANDGKGPVEFVLVAVKLDAMSSEHTRNAQRPFLSG